MTAPILSQEYLKELLHYCPETGIFTWLPRPLNGNYSIHNVMAFNKAFAGKPVGHVNKRGYLRAKIIGHGIQLHRLAWFYTHGEWPKYAIDHINHIKSDNRLSNLRDIPQKENCKNRNPHSRNKSGESNIYWHAHNKRWIVSFVVNYRRIYIGSFINKADAIKVRDEALLRLGFHNNHGKPIR